MSAAETFSSSKQRLMNTPREYSMVPMAPSATRTPCDNLSRNACARVMDSVVMKGMGPVRRIIVFYRIGPPRRGCGTLRRMRFALFLLGLAAAARAETSAERFDRLMRELIIVDTHIDTPGYIVDEGYRLADRHSYYELDVPRMRKGGMGAVFFGVYV